MVGGVKGLARRPFDGHKREGSRHPYLLRELRKRGCRPEVDHHGNIWVEKGSGKRTVLFSSHIDVDPNIRKIVFRAGKEGGSRVLSGVLDNAVGCYINMLLAEKGPRKGNAIYVFTASEEAEKRRPRRFAKSAREVVKELKRRRIRPDFCVAIDVTYPRLLRSQEKMDWDREYEELFDAEDKTHCYLDGFSRPVSRRLATQLVERFRSPKVAVRDFHGQDEAFVYDRLSPSFAFGPVVYGHFNEPEQKMPLAHLRTALRFLRRI